MKISEYYEEYVKQLNAALETVDTNQLKLFNEMLVTHAKYGKPIYVMGNGGSAAIAEHFSCDHTKGVCHDTTLKSNVISLSSNMSLITAIGNDYGYEYIFSKQLEYFNEKGLVVAISSSGNSPNIINGINAATEKGFPVVAMVGFDGGKALTECDVTCALHVKAYNYGIVEDAHQILMHTLAQFTRISCSKGTVSKL